MTYYEQLRELLCEVPEIKEDLEELRFGCEYINIYTKPKTEKIISDIRGGNFYGLIDGFETHFPHTSQIEKIIGNPIEERHIRMYLEQHNYYFDIRNNLLRIWRCNTNNLSGGEMCNIMENIKYNNSKSFHQQNEEVYKQLVEYFISVNN